MIEYSTGYGTLRVKKTMLKLVEQNGNVIECRRLTDVTDQQEAEEIAKSMHNLEGRFAWSGRFTKCITD